MAMMNCPECGKEVSESCKICIHCGYKIAMTNVKKIYLICALVAQVLTLVYSFLPLSYNYNENGPLAVPLNVYYLERFEQWPLVFLFSVFALLAGLGAILFFAAKLSKKLCRINDQKELWLLPAVAFLFQLGSANSMELLDIGNCQGFTEIGTYFWWALGASVVLFSALAGAEDIKSLFKKADAGDAEQQEIETATKKKYGLKYIIEAAVLILLIIAPIVVTICLPRENNNDDSGLHYVVTESLLMENAKQLAVNACCEYTNVSRVRMDYGTENLYPEGEYLSMGWYDRVPYKVELMGTFYPVDDYGEYGDRYRFSIVVYLNEEGRGLVEERESSISKVYY